MKSSQEDNRSPALSWGWFAACALILYLLFIL
jgi:hypothetical protein